MMCYYDNFTLGCWLYLALHGSYGIFWITKDSLFPDAAWQTKVSLFGALLITIFWPLLGYGSYLLCSRQTSPETLWPSNEHLFLTLLLFLFGIVLMMGSDGQKHFVLKNKKGLISDGFFKWSRNTNYLGEIMIYSSFALLVKEDIYWLILLSKWSVVFSLRIIQKEYSLSQKAGY
jgi:protein-S-isoprenylcysteine O-methyltransferase Ste14